MTGDTDLDREVLKACESVALLVHPRSTAYQVGQTQTAIYDLIEAVLTRERFEGSAPTCRCRTYDGY